jgi:hypothetical protein
MTSLKNFCHVLLHVHGMHTGREEFISNRPMLEERTRQIERQKDIETEREAFSTNFGVKKEQDR